MAYKMPLGGGIHRISSNPAVHVEHVDDEAGGRTVGVSRREAELNAVVGQHHVDPAGDGFDQGCQEGRCHDARGALHQLHEGEFAGPVDGHEEAGECQVFCVWLIGSMLPERSKDDDDFQRTAGRVAEGL